MENQQNGLVRKPSKIEVLKDIMKAPSIQEQFTNVLKENTGAFVASVIDLFNSESSLQNCEPKAIVMEALKAAVLKLPINKTLGFAYLVPFSKSKKVGNEWVKEFIPTMIIGYKGYIQMAMRTGQYRIINADVIKEGEYRSKNKLTGEFDLSGQATSEKTVGYFAHIELLNGFTKTMYSTTDQIVAHAKKYSKSFNNDSSAWKTDFDAMAKKTVLRALLTTYGYLSIEMISAIDRDIESEESTISIDQEINENANKQEMGFTNADVVNEPPAENVNHTQPEVKPEQKAAAPF